MKYPKKIYLQFDPEGESNDSLTVISSGTDWFDGVTWCQDKINSNDILYIRADLASVTQQVDSPDAQIRCNCDGKIADTNYCAVHDRKF